MTTRPVVLFCPRSSRLLVDCLHYIGFVVIARRMGTKEALPAVSVHFTKRYTQRSCKSNSIV